MALPSVRSNKLGTMKRRFLAACGFLFAPVVILGYGCGSDEPDIEDLCGWVGDPDNCYLKFAEDIGDRCGVAGLGNAPLGSFLSRDSLDICILTEGGQVIFDPPLDLAELPPEKIGFKMINTDGTECGSGEYKSEFSYTLTIEPDPVPDSGSTEGLVLGGTFQSKTVQGNDTLSTTCPSGESHFFDRLQITKCREYEAIVPQAEIEINAGGIDPIEGFIKLRIFFPPTDGALENAQPNVVEYFQCAIPPAPKPCFNGVQDGGETDVDCGGNEELCPTRCEEGQKCLETTDCATGTTCEFELGLKTCLASGTGGSG